MTNLIFALIAWINSNSNYAQVDYLPNVVMTNSYNMCLRYGISGQGNCQAAQLAGFYDKDLTIYLSTRFNSEDLIDQSKLVHELVHYLQWQNGEYKQRCLGQLEVDAYRIQDAWLESKGLAPRSDEFKLIMLEASCDA